jgi:hypothetical protein
VRAPAIELWANGRPYATVKSLAANGFLFLVNGQFERPEVIHPDRPAEVVPFS